MHQEAQKSTRTYWPRSDESVTGLPSRSFKVKSGATAPGCVALRAASSSRASDARSLGCQETAADFLGVAVEGFFKLFRLGIVVISVEHVGGRLHVRILRNEFLGLFRDGVIEAANLVGELGLDLGLLLLVGGHIGVAHRLHFFQCGCELLEFRTLADDLADILELVREFVVRAAGGRDVRKELAAIAGIVDHLVHVDLHRQGTVLDIDIGPERILTGRKQGDRSEDHIGHGTFESKLALVHRHGIAEGRAVGKGISEDGFAVEVAGLALDDIAGLLGSAGAEGGDCQDE